ncbi:MAG: hypothetical protein NTW03_07305, partial [Verrucomicrobia bacterium]|nr:hypothetical protein [Verrucomicrobiota bacterium]
KMIEEAEYVLRDLGFRDVRVRHHELHATPLSVPGTAAGAAFGHLARIEVAPEEMPKFLANGSASKTAEALKKLGYAHVTLDLLGYRRGSVNEGIVLANQPASAETAGQAPPSSPTVSQP